MRPRTVLLWLVVAPASLLGWVACGEAILGVRPLECDGSPCPDPSLGDAGKDTGESCPEVEEPSCEGGSPIAEHDAGCIVGYVCGDGCASRGGTCTSRIDCPGARWRTSGRSECSESAGLGCCTPCVPISAPPPDYCDGGVISEVFEGECLVGFECR